MVRIALADVSKSYGGAVAVDRFDDTPVGLPVSKRSRAARLQSAIGSSTIWRRNRDIGMVFQNYALYPPMSVYDNMSFGLLDKSA